MDGDLYQDRMVELRVRRPGVVEPAEAPEVHGQAVHLAELAFPDQPADQGRGRVVAVVLRYREGQTPGPGDLDGLPCLRQGHRERLLDQDVAAGLQRGERDRAVRGDGHRGQYRVGVGPP